MYKTPSHILTILLLSHFACAQQETVVKPNLFVKQASVAMTRAPAGGKMGEIYINTPVTVEKEEGDWALVSLKAWVKKEGLGAASAPSAAGVSQAKPTLSQVSDVLLIESFSTRIVEQGLPEKRVYLTLKLKNNSQAPIQSWKALLVASSVGSKEVAFREQISDDTKIIAPGQTIELNFYWEPSEQPFSYLQDATAADLKLELYQLVLE